MWDMMWMWSVNVGYDVDVRCGDGCGMWNVDVDV